MPAQWENWVRRASRLRQGLRGRGYHLVFGLSIISLAALIAWWAVFINAAVQKQHDYQYESMMSSAKGMALLLGHSASTQPLLGQMAQDPRLEIVRQAASRESSAVALSPYWSEFSIRPRPEYVQQVEEKYRRQKLMLIGESSFLLVIILISSFMLYRLIWLERRSSRELREFWGRITHELKTPITGVKAFLQTLEHRDFSREELKPLVQLALRSVERQEMLAENLLIGQRLGKGSLGLQLRAFDLKQRVQAFVAEHSALNPHGAMLYEQATNDKVTVKADPDALWVILENLTDNALKYGGGQPRITYRVAATTAQASVTVSDHGEGFEPAFAELIFEAYNRLAHELPQGRHGTGMGLYLSRQLARKMRGELRADSPGRGQGSSFILTLRRV